jgi:hypothetical protein
LAFVPKTASSMLDAEADDTKIRRLKNAGKTFSKQGARPDKDRRKRWTPHEDASQLFFASESGR